MTFGTKKLKNGKTVGYLTFGTKKQVYLNPVELKEFYHKLDYWINADRYFRQSVKGYKASL